MKCIKDIKTGDISRVEDTVASKKVDAKTHIYAAKSLWKSKGRAESQHVHVEKKEKKIKGLKVKKAKKEVAETPEVKA